MRKQENFASVFVDADNTLWDTDSVYARAQINLLNILEGKVGRKCVGNDRLSFVRSVDQGISERHHHGLRYPPRLLVFALADALHSEDVQRAVRGALTGRGVFPICDTEVGSLVGNYVTDLSLSPDLRPGVEKGLLMLKEANCAVLIITEGSKAKVALTAEKLGIGTHFTRIVEGDKRPELYRRILRLTKKPDRAFMVGDQLDRDIEPAKAAGLSTIYFPGGFLPRWTVDLTFVRPDYVIDNFAEVPSIVLGRNLFQHEN